MEHPYLRDAYHLGDIEINCHEEYQCPKGSPYLYLSIADELDKGDEYREEEDIAHAPRDTTGEEDKKPSCEPLPSL